MVVQNRALFDALEVGPGAVNGAATPRKTYYETLAYNEYLALLASAYVALLPLAGIETESYKSDLKFIEAASRGAVCIASPLIYAETIRHGETGWIARDAGEWRDCLARAITDADARTRIAQAAWRQVRETRLLCHQVERRLAWYRSLWQRREALTRRLVERFPDSARLRPLSSTAEAPVFPMQPVVSASPFPSSARVSLYSCEQGCQNSPVVAADSAKSVADSRVLGAGVPEINRSFGGLPPYRSLGRQRRVGRKFPRRQFSAAHRRIRHGQHVVCGSERQARTERKIAVMHIGISDEPPKPPKQRYRVCFGEPACGLKHAHRLWPRAARGANQGGVKAAERANRRPTEITVAVEAHDL